MVRLEIPRATQDRLREVLRTCEAGEQRLGPKEGPSRATSTVEGGPGSGLVSSDEQPSKLIAQLKAAVDDVASPAIVEHDLLVQAARLARKTPPRQTETAPSHPATTLDVLLRGCKPYFPPRKAFVRSAELEATLARIRRQQEEAEYNAMLDGPTSSSSALASGPRNNSTGGLLDDEATQWREVSSHLSALLNIALSTVAVVVAVWWWTAGGATSREARVAMCAGFGLVIVVAEGFLYARHFDRTRQTELDRRQRRRGAGVAVIQQRKGDRRQQEEEKKEPTTLTLESRLTQAKDGEVWTRVEAEKTAEPAE